MRSAKRPIALFLILAPAILTTAFADPLPSWNVLPQ
jgi:hypothetical protein